MSEPFVIDARTRPNVVDLLRVGAAGVIGYLAPLPNAKVMSPAEAHRYGAAGIPFGLVWESTAKRALGGAAAGRADAIEANRQADALGVDDTMPIYFAVDFAADPGAVAPYFEAVHQHSRRPVGCYGGKPVFEGMMAVGFASFGWQAGAASWSDHQLSTRACLVQKVGGSPLLNTDLNVVQHPDWGQWPRPTPPKPPAKKETGMLVQIQGQPDVWLVASDLTHKVHVPGPPDINHSLAGLQFVLTTNGGDGTVHVIGADGPSSDWLRGLPELGMLTPEVASAIAGQIKVPGLTDGDVARVVAAFGARLVG